MLPQWSLGKITTALLNFCLAVINLVSAMLNFIIEFNLNEMKRYFLDSNAMFHIEVNNNDL